MVRVLFDLIYGSQPAEFKSTFGLSESVARLQAATRRHAFGVLRKQAAAGPVSESRVRLQRVIPMVGNSFKPFFFGRFEVRGDGVYLIGRFTMLGLTKAFMTVWLGAALTFGIAHAMMMIYARGEDWLLLLPGLGLFAAGIGLVALGKWFAKNDASWLSDVILTALSAPKIAESSKLPASTALMPRSASRAPTVLRVTALILLFIGVMEVGFSISGISSWNSSSEHTGTVRFASWPPYLVTGVHGTCTLGLAFGVYRRKQWAWRLGLVFLAAAGLHTLSQAFISTEFPHAIIKAIFCVLSLAVVLYWGWWWHAQRAHFSSGHDPQRDSGAANE